MNDSKDTFCGVLPNGEKYKGCTKAPGHEPPHDNGAKAYYDGTEATFEDAESEIEDILRRADDWDLYDGDEDQQWIFENKVLPDLKKLADAYRQLKGTGCVFIPTEES